MSAFPRLFSPMRIAGVELRNRLVMSPMETQYHTREGLPSERTIGYFEARAAGGVGLVTLGASSIDETHREVPNSLHFGSDAVVEAHRALTERVHLHGAKIQPQLMHPGPDGLTPYLSGVANVGPSVIPSYLTGLPCRELELDEIPGLIDQYRAAARRVVAAGYDGIELHAAHGYMLLGSFLSPWRNRRTDAYGGARPDTRARLVCEVAAAIKEEVGADFPLTLRLSGYERVPGGRPSTDTPAIAERLVEAGVDAFHVSGGVIDRLTTQMVTGSHYGEAHNRAAARALRQRVRVPVMTVGRIHDPGLAETILRDGDADLIVMGRPLLADPELANKCREGRVTELRPCISCQNCIDSMETGRTTCAVNPRTGSEIEWPPGPASTPRRVVVVGGGPAGLEAARVAATRGHRVVLYEAEPVLGGALRLASVVHAENEPFLDYLCREVARLPVELRLGVRADAAAVEEEAADAVILATGGRLAAPTIPGDQHAHVWSGALLRRLLAGRPQPGDAIHLRGWQHRGAAWLARPSAQRALTPKRIRAATRRFLPLGRRIAIVGGDLAALELAEFLAERGRIVTVLEPGPELAPEVGLKRRTEHADRLDRLGVAVHAETPVVEITRDAVVLGAGGRIPADHVILAGTIEPDARLRTALEGRVPVIHEAGDCTGLGLIRKATLEGARAAWSL